jgi:hypothetical protein
MTLIETKTLGAAAASIEFTSIPQDGTDLLFLFSGRSSRSSVLAEVAIALNSNTSDFTNRRLFGNGSNVFSDSNTAGGRGIGFVSGASTTANTFGNSALYIPNYTAAVNKSMSSDSVYENNATEAHQVLFATLWANTAAITSVAFTLQDATNWVIGSTISLYKITKGSDGIVTTSSQERKENDNRNPNQGNSKLCHRRINNSTSNRS